MKTKKQVKVPEKLSLVVYLNWVNTPQAKSVSQPNFFPNGVIRTINILKGKANEPSVKKWRSFGARHYAQYLSNPTARRRYALKNWGYAVTKLKTEQDNSRV